VTASDRAPKLSLSLSLSLSPFFVFAAKQKTKKEDAKEGRKEGTSGKGIPASSLYFLSPPFLSSVVKEREREIEREEESVCGLHLQTHEVVEKPGLRDVFFPALQTGQFPRTSRCPPVSIRRPDSARGGPTGVSRSGSFSFAFSAELCDLLSSDEEEEQPVALSFSLPVSVSVPPDASGVFAPTRGRTSSAPLPLSSLLSTAAS